MKRGELFTIAMLLFCCILSGCEFSAAATSGTKVYNGLLEFVYDGSSDRVAIGDSKDTVREKFSKQLTNRVEECSIGDIVDGLIIEYDDYGLVSCICANDPCGFSVLGLSTGSPVSEVYETFGSVSWEDDAAVLYFDSSLSMCKEMDSTYTMMLIRDEDTLSMIVLAYLPSYK